MPQVFELADDVGVSMADAGLDLERVNWALGLGTSESSAALTGQHELQSEKPPSRLIILVNVNVRSCFEI